MNIVWVTIKHSIQVIRTKTSLNLFFLIGSEYSGSEVWVFVTQYKEGVQTVL